MEFNYNCPVSKGCALIRPVRRGVSTDSLKFCPTMPDLSMSRGRATLERALSFFYPLDTPDRAGLSLITDHPQGVDVGRKSDTKTILGEFHDQGDNVLKIIDTN
jgi:hypothetical protein